MRLKANAVLVFCVVQAMLPVSFALPQASSRTSSEMSGAETSTVVRAKQSVDIRVDRARSFAEWLNSQGVKAWEKSPEFCTDLEFARRAFLDILGRVPSVSEIRDFEAMPGDRRKALVERLVFGPISPREAAEEVGEQQEMVGVPQSPGQMLAAKDYGRLSSQQMARHWVRILSPSDGVVQRSLLEGWLQQQFAQSVPYDQLMRPLVELDDESGPPQYYRQVALSPVDYAGTVARSMLGVRIECAQCHDHPFADWRQEDFWGLAAFYANTNPETAQQPDADLGQEPLPQVSTIVADGVQYSAKLLWSEELIAESPELARKKLSSWLCSEENPFFVNNAANRFWQYLVGRGLYPDVENLDQASEDERLFMEQVGARFAEVDFDIQVLIAAICQSDWYQAKSSSGSSGEAFYRPMKTVSAEQIFDSLEQSLLLPVGRADSESPRWSGAMGRLISRLEEAESSSPEEFVSGVPQALAIMNGEITANATQLEQSRLLRAVVESPFFSEAERIEVIYLAVLTRRPTAQELEKLVGFVKAEHEEGRGQEVLGEILWALINSPEFVLCR